VLIEREKENTMKNIKQIILTAVISASIVTTAVAQMPVASVDPSRHGNLAAAQQDIQQAFNSISAAQRENDDQLGGHAGRAKDLLRQANDEIAAAASVADGHAMNGAAPMSAAPVAASAPMAENTPPPPPALPNISGNWTIYAYNVSQPGSSLKQVQLAQVGNIISGTFHGPHQHGKLQGWISGDHLEFSTDTSDVLTFRGQVTPTGMSGMYGVHGRTAPWSAERSN
jgi:hypothetical protein